MLFYYLGLGKAEKFQKALAAAAPAQDGLPTYLQVEWICT